MNRHEDTKSLIILLCIAAPFVVWLSLIVAGAYVPGNNLFELFGRITESLNNPMRIKFNEYSLRSVLVFLFLYAMGIGVYFSSRENRRPGEEHGSAKWGNVSAIARKYEDREDKKSNLIFTSRMRLGLNAKKHRRNLNVLVVGGSGAGKTRFYAKPNIMQCNTS